VEVQSVEEILEEIRLLLKEEDIPFREVMDMLLLAISLMKEELYSLLGLKEQLKSPSKERKAKAIGKPRGRTHSRGRPSVPSLCPCGKTFWEKGCGAEDKLEGVL